MNMEDLGNRLWVGEIPKECYTFAEEISRKTGHKVEPLAKPPHGEDDNQWYVVRCRDDKDLADVLQRLGTDGKQRVKVRPYCTLFKFLAAGTNREMTRPVPAPAWLAHQEIIRAKPVPGTVPGAPSTASPIVDEEIKEFFKYITPYWSRTQLPEDGQLPAVKLQPPKLMWGPAWAVIPERGFTPRDTSAAIYIHRGTGEINSSLRKGARVWLGGFQNANVMDRRAWAVIQRFISSFRRS